VVLKLLPIMTNKLVFYLMDLLLLVVIVAKCDKADKAAVG
jgi:hypothetical protein